MISGEQRPSMQRTRVSSRGQITVPKELRDRLRLKPGDGVEFEFLGDRLEVRPARPQDPDKEAPPWFVPVATDLMGVLRLERGWNSYAAQPISPRAAGAVLALLSATMDVATPPPAVVPMSRGDIQLEWHLRGMDIEVVVPDEGPVRVWYADLQQHEERELALTDGPEPLREILCELTARS
jgi:AbrB family looped-hinge helix DNA binding protein